MKCGTCGEEYERNNGPMIQVCTPCLNKPPKPDSYVKLGNLWVPNK